MKKAEEILNGWNLCANDTQIIQDIKQIQLDAMREGMRRAARINRANMDKWMLTGTTDAGYGAEVSALDILSAAEQLTTKAL